MDAMTNGARTRGDMLLAAHRYSEARAVLEPFAADAEDPEILVGLATACRVLDDVPAATSALEQAYRLHVRAKDASGAARDAFTLANLALENLGAASVAKGWLGRARQHLARTPADPSLVEVFGLEAYLALAHDKDPQSALAYAELSVRQAESVGEAAALLVGNAYLGFIQISMGDLGEGMRLLEASVAAASAGELAPAQQLDVFCLLLTACERIRDVERVDEWSRRVLDLAVQQGSDPFAAFARTQYANALLLRGEWDAADEELERVLRDGESRPLTAAMGLVLRATLRRLQGRLDEADALLRSAECEPYRRAVRHLVVANRAALELAQGDAIAAADLAERYLRMVASSDVIERIDALEVLVRARLAQHDHARADLAADELAVTAELVPTAGVRAAAVFARGLVEAATGQLELALAHLADAADAFDQAGLAYHAADARLELAGLLCDAGRPAAARRAAEQALAAADRLGATTLAVGAERLRRSVRESASTDGLTRREAEVLGLAAAGLANAEIADGLSISVRTVERHLSNIYLKIGATGPAARAIAIAYGRDHALV